ncbi:MAG TPA: MBL fold metallo-hydrolase [Burkholderiaceae bacterium]|nr:MBL fold metallo-hydrolase [Burkholderiaceae bacterium]
MNRSRSATWVAVLGTALWAMTFAAEAEPSSPHFQLEQLAEGVWAAIATPGEYAICNMGIIDLGADVVLFDAGQSPEAATDLAAAAQRLTGRAPTILVYSHGHNDHVRGATALAPDTVVIGTAGIRDDMIEDEKSAAEDAADIGTKLWLYRQYEAWDARAGPAGEARFWRAYMQAVAETGRKYKARLPTRFIEGGTMVLSGPRRKVVLDELSGHTKSDVVALLHEDHVVFAGDLPFVRHHPFLGDSPGSAKMLHALDALRAEAPARYVPGHGAVAGVEAIESMSEYVSTLRGLVAETKRRGLTEDWLAGRSPPPQYSSWWFGRFFPSNIKAIFDEAN